jgi:ATP-binding cassette subfamily G (WHITE) protein 2 (SNQ2)
MCYSTVSLAIGNQLINCADKELVTVEPPSGQTCGEFMARYISSSGGYLTNPDASAACRFCSSRTTDQWMEPKFNIFYRHHWRDFGLFCAYILFNVRFLDSFLILEMFAHRNISDLCCLSFDLPCARSNPQTY